MQPASIIRTVTKLAKPLALAIVILTVWSFTESSAHAQASARDRLRAMRNGSNQQRYGQQMPSRSPVRMPQRSRRRQQRERSAPNIIQMNFVAQTGHQTGRMAYLHYYPAFYQRR